MIYGRTKLLLTAAVHCSAHKQHYYPIIEVKYITICQIAERNLHHPCTNPSSKYCTAMFRFGRRLAKLGRGKQAAFAVAFASVALPAITLCTEESQCSAAPATPSPDVSCPNIKALPVIRQSEVAQHTTPQTGIWTTYKDGVYDITTFVASHPGGEDKIKLAAGKAVEPFWRLYRKAKYCAACVRRPPLCNPPLARARVLALLLLTGSTTNRSCPSRFWQA